MLVGVYIMCLPADSVLVYLAPWLSDASGLYFFRSHALDVRVYDWKKNASGVQL